MGKNIETVRQFFEYYAKEDLIGMGSVMTEDTVWNIPGHHPLAGKKRGKVEVLAFFKELQKSRFKADLRILAENDNYVIDCHRGWGDFEGHSIDMNWVLLYKIENGLIAEVQSFPGDQHAADDFFWNAYPMNPVQTRLVLQL